MRSAEEKLEFKRKLEKRTADFAVRVFRFLDGMPVCVSSKVLAFQLGKSASSIGANYREANRSESGDDFKHKVSIALKECSESLYWVELLAQMYPENADVKSLAQECEELLRLFQTIRRHVKARDPRSIL